MTSRILHRVGALATLLLLAACGHNIEKGDKDYPRVNPSPAQYFHLHGTINGAIDVRFTQLFEATDPSCSYSPFMNAGGPFVYTVSREIAVHREGQQYSAKVAADEFSPGRCGWKMRYVEVSEWYIGEHPIGLPSGSDVIPTNSLPLGLGQNPDGVLSIDCKVVQASDGKFFFGHKPGRFVCYSPDNWSLAAEPSVLWYPETKDITINYRLVTQDEFDRFVKHVQ